jgi:ABC-type multidrug transport system ATPase subunit
MDRSFSVASLIANSQFTFIALTSAFLVNAADIPVYVSWVKYISYLSYSYRLLMSNELTDATFTSCASGYCVTVQGNDVLKAQKLSPNDFTEPWAVLFAMAVAYHLLALVFFHLVKRPPTGSVGGDGDGDGDVDLGDLGIFTVVDEEGDVELASVPAPTPAEKEGDTEIDVEPPKVVVTAKGISLSVDVRGVELRILRHVSAVFRPGRVCALMGGSGSGKTSLLDLIARRSRNIKKTGSILYNGAVASDAAVRQMCGYVQQYDFHLPSLTVRETLLFNANLLMPESVSYEQKNRRVEKLISLLGLRQCANTRVGGEEIKGVSGGEKRRLSVGCQLILDPSCALLDEVTTGLDAFSARSVVQTLRDLSRRGEGRTVILSIHQPRYDIFSLCDDVVLLSQGRCVWSGAREDMLAFLARQGCPCPSLSNPADHALDVSSIDLRSPDKEAESRDRVERLVAAFAALKADQQALVQTEGGVHRRGRRDSSSGGRRRRWKWFGPSTRQAAVSRAAPGVMAIFFEPGQESSPR